MMKRKIKQIICGIALIVVGWCSVPIEGDATYALFATALGAVLIFSNERII